MNEQYRWNDLIKIRTKDNNYVEERPTEPPKPLVYNEVREVHRKSLVRPFYKGGNTNGIMGKKSK